jgi:anti-sigma factor RsiW
MCDRSGKLIAWLDGELPPQEAAEIAGHVRGCEACRSEVETCKRLSRAINAYAESVFEVRSPHPSLPVKDLRVAIAGIALVLFALALVVPRAGKLQPPEVADLVAAPAPVPRARADVSRVSGESSVPGPVENIAARVPRKRTIPRERKQVAIVQPPAPEVQVWIPADALFPPGAVPEGVSFVADVSFAADGSAQEVFVRP